MLSLIVARIFVHSVLCWSISFLFLTKIKFLIPVCFLLFFFRKLDALFLRLYIWKLAYLGNSKSYFFLIVFVNSLPLADYSSSISLVLSSFQWSSPCCFGRVSLHLLLVLNFPLWTVLRCQLSFASLFSLQKFNVSSLLILFIKFSSFCLNFNFSSFAHSPLFMIWTLLLCNWLEVFVELITL